MLKRIASVLLLLALLTSALSSCGNESSDAPSDSTPPDASADSSTELEETDNGGDGNETEEEPTSALLAATTPEMKTELGLDGFALKVMVREPNGDWTIKDLVAEEETGEVLNDAVYRRNSWLEDNFGFTIEPGYSADTQLSEMRTYIMAGDNPYDVYFPMARTAAPVAQEGMLYNLKNLKYVDFDNPSWNSMFNDALTLGDKLFYATGDISTNSYAAVCLFYFNKDIVANYGLDKMTDGSGSPYGTPYDMVRNGTWTFDNYDTLAQAVTLDVDGDSVIGDNDLHGMVFQNTVGGLFFYYGAGEQITVMEDGIPVISVGSERSTAVYDKIKDMMSRKDVYYLSPDYQEIQSWFQEGHGLFLAEVLDVANRMRPYDINFGILPAPKFDETQQQYIQFANGWCISPVVVPANAANADRIGFCIEALAEASTMFITQPYYDTVLTGKALRDDESAEMLDIAVHNFVLDNTDIFSWSNVSTLLMEGMENGKELSSIIAATQRALQVMIDKTVEDFENIQ